MGSLSEASSLKKIDYASSAAISCQQLLGEEVESCETLPRMLGFWQAWTCPCLVYEVIATICFCAQQCFNVCWMLFCCVCTSLCISCFSNAVTKHCDQGSLQKKAFHWAYSFRMHDGRVKARWQEELRACDSESQVESRKRELEIGGRL